MHDPFVGDNIQTGLKEILNSNGVKLCQNWKPALIQTSVLHIGRVIYDGPTAYIAIGHAVFQIRRGTSLLTGYVELFKPEFGIAQSILWLGGAQKLLEFLKLQLFLIQMRGI